MSDPLRNKIISGENPFISRLPVEGSKPITVIASEAIRNGFEDGCIQQAINSKKAPGVSDFILNPDAHHGHGVPVGSVLISDEMVYPAPVGPDIKCSMSLIQTDLPEDAFQDKKARRAFINAVLERIPTGIGNGQRSVPKSRHVNSQLGELVVTAGASQEVCQQLGIPLHWADRCEDRNHGYPEALRGRLNRLVKDGVLSKLQSKYEQLGSYGGGNHFLSADVVRVLDSKRDLAAKFGLKDGKVSVLSHCGSRGFGFVLAQNQFKSLLTRFQDWNIPLPGGDKDLVYAPIHSQEGRDYLDDMSLGGNFATVNHLLINALILEAFQEVFPGVQGDLVYYISHNIIREEIINNKPVLVHRKGATRAIPAGHFSLKDTQFFDTGHPILLPGNVTDGSLVMVGEQGAEVAAYSVNHGAGRCMGRKAAERTLNQDVVNNEINRSGIVTNCRNYPLDESACVYKQFEEVIRSVEGAGLASSVAKLVPMAVVKDVSNNEKD